LVFDKAFPLTSHKDYCVTNRLAQDIPLIILHLEVTCGLC